MQTISRVLILSSFLFMFGCFANWAGNEWGLTILQIATSMLAVSLFISAIITKKIKNQEDRKLPKKLGERIQLIGFGLILTGIILKLNWIAGAFLFMVIGALIVVLSGLTEILFVLLKRKNEWFNAVVQSVFVSFCLSFVFKTLHWPYADIFAIISVSVLLVGIVLFLILVLRRIKPWEIVKWVHPNILIFIILISVYQSLDTFRLAPAWHATDLPLGLYERMAKEGTTNEVIVYRNNYEVYTELLDAYESDEPVPDSIIERIRKKFISDTTAIAEIDKISAPSNQPTDKNPVQLPDSLTHALIEIE